MSFMQIEVGVTAVNIDGFVRHVPTTNESYFWGCTNSLFIVDNNNTKHAFNSENAKLLSHAHEATAKDIAVRFYDARKLEFPDSNFTLKV